MRLPKNIKVGAYKYKVIYKDKIVHNDKELWGMCDRHSQTIYLTKGMPEGRRLETFLHEVIHAFEEIYDFSLTEKQVHMLGVSLAGFLKDNKIQV